MGENGQIDNTKCNENSETGTSSSAKQSQTQPPKQTTTNRFADYFVICGLDLDTGLEPDRFAGKYSLRKKRHICGTFKFPINTIWRFNGFVFDNLTRTFAAALCIGRVCWLRISFVFVNFDQINRLFAHICAI